MVTSDLRAEVEMWPFRACAVNMALIIGTIRSLWTWLWGRYHVPQNIFLVMLLVFFNTDSSTCLCLQPSEIKMELDMDIGIFFLFLFSISAIFPVICDDSHTCIHLFWLPILFCGEFTADI